MKATRSALFLFFPQNQEGKKASMLRNSERSKIVNSNACYEGKVVTDVTDITGARAHPHARRELRIRCASRFASY